MTDITVNCTLASTERDEKKKDDFCDNMKLPYVRTWDMMLKQSQGILIHFKKDRGLFSPVIVRQNLHSEASEITLKFIDFSAWKI